MISIRFHGRFANQAIQYVHGKILAERTGQRFVPPPHFLDAEFRPLQWTDEPLFKMTETPGRDVPGVPQTLKVKQWYDYDALDPNRSIIVRELFGQRWELLAPWKERIRHEWLRIEPRRFMPTDDEAAFLHCRLTDYVRLADGSLPDPREKGAATKPEEFSWCLREFTDCKRLYIVSDDPDEAETLGWDKILYDAGCKMEWSVLDRNAWDADFLLLVSARNLVISQSTYSWLAGLLGRAAKIVCPCPEGSFWRRGLGSLEQPDLFLPSDTDREWVWCLDANARLRSVRTGEAVAKGRT